MKWALTKIESQMRAWLAEPENRLFMHDHAMARIEQAMMSGPSAQAAAGVATDLELLASWNETAAAIDILAGRDRWRDLQENTFLSALKVRLLSDLFHQDGRPNRQARLSANETAIVVAQALALNCLELFRQLSVVFLAGRADGSIGGWSVTPFAAFVASLCKLFLDEVSSEQGLGSPYADIEKGLRLSDRLVAEQAIKAACDYHLENWDDADDSGFPEFEEYPLPVFPVEILAVLRLCEIRGLKVDLPNHPLLASHLGRLPLVGPPVPPLLHDRVLRWWAPTHPT